LTQQVHRGIIFLLLALVLASSTGCRLFKKRTRYSYLDEDYIKELPTYNLDINADIHPEPDKGYLIIYVEKPAEYLIGNPCVEQYTAQRGYVLAPYTDFPERNPSEIRVWYENLPRKWSLIFKLGPMWKRNLHRRVRQCRASSGDFVG
jgi:hypothetical protein